VWWGFSAGEFEADGNGTWANPSKLRCGSSNFSPYNSFNAAFSLIGNIAVNDLCGINDSRLTSHVVHKACRTLRGPIVSKTDRGSHCRRQIDHYRGPEGAESRSLDEIPPRRRQSHQAYDWKRCYGRGERVSDSSIVNANELSSKAAT
jgi:hypothetical protein